MKSKIKDFGQKIGGARKDLWKRTGLTTSHLKDLNDAEKKMYVNRDNVWPLISAKKQVEDGVSPFIAYWQRRMRGYTLKEPFIRKDDDFVEKVKTYVEAMTVLKEMVLNVKNEKDISDFYGKVSRMKSELYPCLLTTKFYNLRTSEYDLTIMKHKCQLMNFPYGTKAEDKKKVERRKAFIPPQLINIEREGKDYRRGVNVSPYIWQKNFNFKGIEFGNWMSQIDRQASMNYCFDAFKDMSIALGISDYDISFKGRLSLGFGSRGCSRAVAHYEPLREVINLTKMRGAGSTAHEWAHALDDILGKFCGVDTGKLASECLNNANLPKSFVKLINALKYDCDGFKTDYYKGSMEAGKMYAKEPHGYWSSNPEMFARAFACYLKDIIGCKSDYLIAHADVYEFEFDNERVCAIPQGEERELFDELFENLFYELKKMNFFEERKEVKEIKKIPSFGNKVIDYSTIVNQNIDGQMSFIM